MPAALLSREAVIERLMLVVRREGYDGASIAELSKATGLGKSSLYHYFPAGKEDMVRAVLDQVQSHLHTVLFTPLRAPGPAKRRVEEMIKTVDALYSGGREACMLANLVVGTSRTRFRNELRAIFDEWIDALAAVLVDAGLPRSLARARAEDAVMRIEGALVLVGAMNDVSFFSRTLKRLPAELLAPVSGGG